MAETADDLVKEGIRAYNKGDKATARSMFEQATDTDAYHEQAWLWLSAVVDSVDDQRTCLENVLVINPDNAHARKGLDKLNAKHPPASVAAAPEPEPEPEPPAETSYVPPTATSSASSEFTPEEPSPDEYDNWMASLNLGDSGTGSGASPFSSGIDDLDDDDFTNPFAAMFDPNADTVEDDPFEGTANPFETNASLQEADLRDIEDDIFGGADGPFSSGASDPFGGGDPFVDDPVPARGSAAASMSPGREAAPSRRSASRSSEEEDDPSIYFQAIPADIKASRLPGESVGPSRVMLAAFLILLVLNMVVGVLLMTNLG